MSGMGSAVWCEVFKPPPLPPYGTSMYNEVMQFIRSNATRHGYYKEYTDACNQTLHPVTTGGSTEEPPTRRTEAIYTPEDFMPAFNDIFTSTEKSVPSKEVAEASIGLALGLTLMVLLLLVVCAFIGWWLWKKKRARDSSNALSMDQYETNYLHSKAATGKPYNNSSNVDSPDAGTGGTECGSKRLSSNTVLSGSPATFTTKSEYEKNSPSSDKKRESVKRLSDISNGGHDNPIYQNSEDMTDGKRRSQNGDGPTVTDVDRWSRNSGGLTNISREGQYSDKLTNRWSQNSEDVRRRSNNINGPVDSSSGQNGWSENNDGQVEVSRRSKNGSVSKTGILPNVPDSSENRVSNGHAKSSSATQGVGGGSLPPIDNKGTRSEKRQSGDGKKTKKKRRSSKRDSVETSGEVEEKESSQGQNDG